MKVNPHLVMRMELKSLFSIASRISHQKRKEEEILRLLTQIRPVRIDGVGPRMGLELNTEELTQGLKKAVFLKVFAFLKRRIATQDAISSSELNPRCDWNQKQSG